VRTFYRFLYIIYRIIEFFLVGFVGEQTKKWWFNLENATVKIHHKTMMGSLNDILTIGKLLIGLGKGLEES